MNVGCDNMTEWGNSVVSLPTKKIQYKIFASGIKTVNISEQMNKINVDDEMRFLFQFLAQIKRAFIHTFFFFLFIFLEAAQLFLHLNLFASWAIFLRLHQHPLVCIVHFHRYRKIFNHIPNSCGKIVSFC